MRWTGCLRRASRVARASAGRQRVSPTAEEMDALSSQIERELCSCSRLLRAASSHLFAGRGKTLRPKMTILMARACNQSPSHAHSAQIAGVSREQWTVAIVTEMLHTASLLHDDIIDGSPLRRGLPAVHVLWGEREATLAGNFILSRASALLATTGSTRAVELFATILEDLVGGEVMQLGEEGQASPSSSSARASSSLAGVTGTECCVGLYLERCSRKTASLMANSCKAVAELSGCGGDESDAAFNFGRNVGLAFQIVDDVLDFEGSRSELGKGVRTDLRQGLATGPVLLAAEEFPELNEMIRRRFQAPGDTEHAYRLVTTGSACQRTRAMAAAHSREAVEWLQRLPPSGPRTLLAALARDIVTRKK